MLCSLLLGLSMRLGSLTWTRRATGEHYMHGNKRKVRFVSGISLLVGLLVAASVPSVGQRGTNETIDATAFGTSTQLGRNFGIKVIIYEFSAPEDRDILVQAFQKG